MEIEKRKGLGTLGEKGYFVQETGRRAVGKKK